MKTRRKFCSEKSIRITEDFRRITSIYVSAAANLLVALTTVGLPQQQLQMRCCVPTTLQAPTNRRHVQSTIAATTNESLLWWLTLEIPLPLASSADVAKGLRGCCILRRDRQLKSFGAQCKLAYAPCWKILKSWTNFKAAALIITISAHHTAHNCTKPLHTQIKSHGCSFKSQ